MDSEADRELQVIREQTHQTRAHLAEKLEALESKVTKTVSGVTDAVETVKETVAGVSDAVSNATEAVTDVVSNVTEQVTDVVSNVTESVSGTVESVKETVAETVNALDVQPYIRQAPFTSVGCAFATGLAAGYFMGPSKGNGFMPFNLTGETAVPRDAEAKNGHQATNGHQTSTMSDTLGAVGDTVSELGGSLRSLGISALFGLVSHLAKQAVPEAMKQDVSTALDKLKTRLGGHHNVNPETFLKQ
jgi:ElaB/YqjD/DUF883 family membrane-anchored ribosome-binding protein